MRLCLAKKDYLRALILSCKINFKVFDELIEKEKKDVEKVVLVVKSVMELSEMEKVEFKVEKLKKEG